MVTAAKNLDEVHEAIIRAAEAETFEDTRKKLTDVNIAVTFHNEYSCGDYWLKRVGGHAAINFAVLLFNLSCFSFDITPYECDGREYIGLSLLVFMIRMSLAAFTPCWLPMHHWQHKWKKAIIETRSYMKSVNSYLDDIMHPLIIFLLVNWEQKYNIFAVVFLYFLRMFLGNPFSRAVLKIGRSKVAESDCLSTAFCCCMGEDDTGRRKCCRRTSPTQYSITDNLTTTSTDSSAGHHSDKQREFQREINLDKPRSRCDCLRCDFDLSVRVVNKKKTDEIIIPVSNTSTHFTESQPKLSETHVKISEQESSQTEEKPIEISPKHRRFPSHASLSAIMGGGPKKHETPKKDEL